MYFFFFNDTATTEIYTLSLHDALPILSSATWVRSSRDPSSTSVWSARGRARSRRCTSTITPNAPKPPAASLVRRSEEHTSELQSRLHLVCRLLLEKKKINDSQTEQVEH